MQIFKRIKNKFRPGQNLIEFVFILPVLILLTLVIFEIALFWQDVNSIYDLNAEINANAALLEYTGLNLENTPPDVCPAADEAVSGSAIKILQEKDSMISLNNPVYVKSVLDGREPFALYKFSANPIVVNGKTQPQISLWVDCRNPFEKGVTTQIEFYHKTLIMQASIPRFDKREAIVLIPKNIFIASPKLNTIRHY